MEEDGDHEHDRGREEDRRRVARDPEPPGDRVQAAPPGRENEQHDTGREPEQRVALLESPPADQLEDDQDQEERADRRRDRDPDGCHRGASSDGTAYRRPIATRSARVTFTA